MLSKFALHNSIKLIMKKYFLSLLVVFVFFRANAQEIENNENGTWFTVINKFKVTDKFFALNILQWRFVDDLSHTRVFIVEPSLNYKVTDKVIVGLGYNYSNYSLVGIRPPSLDYETRFAQHVTLLSNFGKVKATQRFMFEERFFVKTDGEDAYRNRFRYRMFLDFKILKFKNDKYLLGRFAEEVRIRFSEGVSDPTFDQNNFVACIGYPLLANSKLYIGYGRNYYNGGTAGYWGDHILNVAFSYSFDFTKKEFYK